MWTVGDYYIRLRYYIFVTFRYHRLFEETKR